MARVYAGEVLGLVKPIAGQTIELKVFLQDTAGAALTGQTFDAPGMLVAIAKPGAAYIAWVTIVGNAFATGNWQEVGYGVYNIVLAGSTAGEANLLGTPGDLAVYVKNTASKGDNFLFRVVSSDSARLTATAEANFLAAHDGTGYAGGAIKQRVVDGSGNAIAPEAGGNIAALVAALTPISGTVNDAAATTTSFITDLASSVSTFWNGLAVMFTNGALTGQLGQIQNYDGPTKRITLQSALTSAPANGAAFRLVATAASRKWAAALAAAFGTDYKGLLSTDVQDLSGKVLGGGSGVMSAAGVRAVDASGHAIAPLSVVAPIAGVVTGVPTDVRFDTNLTSVLGNWYGNPTLLFTSGACTGVAVGVASYVGGIAHTVVVFPALPVAPAAGDAFVLLPINTRAIAGQVWEEMEGDHTALGTLGALMLQLGGLFGGEPLTLEAGSLAKMLFDVFGGMTNLVACLQAMARKDDVYPGYAAALRDLNAPEDVGSYDPAMDSQEALRDAVALEATLAAMKGAGWSTEDSLKAIFDALASITPATGDCVVTITVTDGVLVYPSVKVTVDNLTGDAAKIVRFTNEYGQVVINRDDGTTWLALAGVTGLQNGGSQVFTVDGATAVTITVVAHALPTPTDPGNYVIHSAGRKIEANAVLPSLAVKILSVSGKGALYDDTANTDSAVVGESFPADATTGVWSFQLSKHQAGKTLRLERSWLAANGTDTLTDEWEATVNAAVATPEDQIAWADLEPRQIH